MFSASLRVPVISALLLWGPSSLAHPGAPPSAPPSLADDGAAPAASVASARPKRQPGWTSSPGPRKAKAARSFAYTYLRLWSAPNRVMLASSSAFYGRTVTFHGRTRTLGSVLAEKRRFAQRWPDRDYRYRPETTQVACEAAGTRCTVWSLFEFSAADARFGRRSSGIGEHELVVSLAGPRPVIASENSRVLRRGALQRR